jgi:hypothetical protein
VRPQINKIKPTADKTPTANPVCQRHRSPHNWFQVNKLPQRRLWTAVQAPTAIVYFPECPQVLRNIASAARHFAKIASEKLCQLPYPEPQPFKQSNWGLKLSGVTPSHCLGRFRPPGWLDIKEVPKSDFSHHWLCQHSVPREVYCREQLKARAQSELSEVPTGQNDPRGR